jgi:outer membrane receptor for ferrienterochelin and colicin
MIPRFYRIIFLSTIIVSCTLPTFAERRLGEMSLEELMNVKVSIASGKEVDIRSAPGIVSVITEEEIKALGARDFIDILNQIPGFQFGVDVIGVVGVGVRGIWGHEGKILLLWNGHEMNELLYSTLQFGNHFPVNLIKKIEIIRGPGSALYGGNAELSVINVITKSGSDLDGGEVFVSYGQNRETFSRRNIEFAYGEQVEDFTYDISGIMGEGTRSYKQYTDQAGNSFDLAEDSELNPGMLMLNLKKGNWDARFLYDDYRTKQRDEFTDILSEAVNADFTSYFYDLRYNADISDSLTLIPRVFVKDQIPYRANNNTKQDNTPLNTRAQRAQGEMIAKYKLSNSTDTLWGGQVYSDRARNYIDGESFGNGSQYFDYSGRAFFGQAMMRSDLADFTVGGRYDAHSIFDSAFVPRVSATKIVDNWHFKLLASSAFRNPGIQNISLNQALINDNAPGIDPIKREETTVYELETGYAFSDKTVLVFNVSHTQIDDPIVYTLLNDGAQEGYVNGDKVASLGFEAELKHNFDWGKTAISYSHYAAQNSNVDIYEVPNDSQSYLGFARDKITASASINMNDRTSLTPSLVFLGSRSGYYQIDSSGNSVLKEFDPVVLLNAYISHRLQGIENLELGLGVYNILGQNFSFIQPANNGHAPLPGLSPEVMGRVTYRF